MNAPTFDIERARLVAARRLLPEHFDDFQRLAKSVVHGPPFQLVFIDCADSRYRDRVIESLGEVLRSARLRSSQLPLSERMHDAAALEARLRQHAAKAEIVHIVGAAHWFNAVRWDELNQRRERLARDARARLIFWLNAEAIALLSVRGQDLWAWRSGVYAFEVEAQGPAPATPAWTAATRSLADGSPDTRSMSERHRRVIELRQTLASMPAASLDLRVPLVDELGRLLFDLGEYDDALAHWRDVELPLHRERQDERGVAITMSQIADVHQSRGEFGEALRIRREEALPVYERLGDQHERAVTMGKIADVLQSRGEFDEALRIRREEQLPAYERLGDARSQAVTLGKIADVLASRGELDEALRIWNEEQLPVFERLADPRERAVTMGKIANVLQARGQLDEALRIRREEELPVYERLGDQRSRAVTLGKIADVLQARGQFDEALRIRREEELPVYERLGARRDLLICRAEVAINLRARDHAGDREEARRLLTAALADAEQMQLPEVEALRGLLSDLDAE